MQANNLDDQTITLESEDGRAYVCKILGVFNYESKEYALLLKMADGGEEDTDGESTVIMQLIEKDDQAIFRTIESDEEFERVVAFVKDELLEIDENDEGEEGEE
jgi:uncharacterized protein YrzB (UPF0473 family)